MDRVMEQLDDLCKRERLIFFGQFPYLGNSETNKHIPFTIFPSGSFEIFLKCRGPLSIAKCLQSNTYI